MNHFIDKPDFKDSINKLALLNDEKQIQEFISTNLPNWFVYTTDSYSDDYKYLQDNWKHVCNKIKVKQQKIILVNDIKFDKDHKFLQACCETMTRRGYVVRRAAEFIVCSVCNKAIPTKDIHYKMHEMKAPVPAVYSRKCSSC